MKAVRLHAYGDVDQFHYEDVADPVAGPGQVLVKVAAVSLNPVELFQRQGYLQQYYPTELPAIQGVDLAGTVAAVGAGVTGFAVGDRVVGKLPINGRGSQAELAIATPEQLAKLPDLIDFTTGSTLPLVGLTARQAVDALGAKAGDRVLLTSALGGVGRAAVQYLKEIGAGPVAGVRAERVAEATTLAGEAIDIGAEGKPSFDFAVDTAGQATAGAAIGLLRDSGTLAAVAGVPEGANADGRVTIANIMSTENSKTLSQIVDAAARGDLKIPVSKTFPLKDLGEAHKALAANPRGKVVITV